VFEQVFKPRLFKLGEPDEVQVNRQWDLLRGLGKVLDDQLAANQWVAGDAMTLADIAIAPSLAGLVPLPVEGLTAIGRWFGQVQALDAWKATAPPARRG